MLDGHRASGWISGFRIGKIADGHRAFVYEKGSHKFWMDVLVAQFWRHILGAQWVGKQANVQAGKRANGQMDKRGFFE